MNVRDIARFVNGEIIGNDGTEILRLGKIEDAGPGDVTFIANPKYNKFVETTQASALLVSKGAVTGLRTSSRTTPLTLIVVEDSYRAFLSLIDKFHCPVEPLTKGCHASAVVPASVQLGKETAVGANVVLGERCIIGDRVQIYPGVVLYDDVVVGNDSVIHANVTVREQCRIGNRAIIHSGTVIGTDGFGFAKKPDETYEKIPQRGIVVIEDDVEIGSNCTIDRATIGETLIKRGAKLDNLIQVAHNVVIGEHTVIAGQAGISGSSKIGDFCAFGGQVGIAGHVIIPDHTSIAAQSGVARSITKPGKMWFGSPIKEVPGAYRIAAAISELPELIAQVRELQHQLDELRKQIDEKLSHSTKRD